MKFSVIFLAMILSMFSYANEKMRITDRELQSANLCSLYAVYKNGSEFSEGIPKVDCDNGSYILPMTGVIMGGDQDAVLSEVNMKMETAGLSYKGKLPITPTESDLEKDQKVVQHLFMR